MRMLIALGGNALLQRGQTLSAAAQGKSLAVAAAVLAREIAAGHQLIITHGNGPQVGLLALQSAAGPAASAMPLDVLGAESEGWIGYGLELALRNALPEGAKMLTLLTLTLVDAADLAVQHPSKPIGPIYDAATAQRLAVQDHWTVKPDGASWRRVVASPKPIEILELDAIKVLVEAGMTVICGGGGGIPVIRRSGGELTGVEAVIDKDATSALLAERLGAERFIMLTDVDGVYLDFGTPNSRMIKRSNPAELRAQQLAFAAGSMGPKIAAACGFVTATGSRCVIGATPDLHELIAGTAGTEISPDIGPGCSASHESIARAS
jgi:carbamate kinase